MDKISVIVPVYKVEKYINKCVDSILAQTYKNIEVILVDDGSPDNCGKICDEYAEKDPRVRVIHKENGGLSDARNAGLNIATGEYIGFVDSDDYIAPEMYEKLLYIATENSADIALCNFKYVGDGVYDNENSPVKNEILTGKDILFKKMSMPRPWYWIVAWNKLYKREIFKSIRYPYGKLHEDEFVIHKIMLNCSKVACAGDMLYCYLQRGDSIVGARLTVRHLDLAEALFDRAKYYIKNRCGNKFICDTLIGGIYITVMRYRKCKKLPGAKKRYDELVSIYRKLVCINVMKGVPLYKRIRLCLASLFPYITETAGIKIKRNYRI